MFKQDQPPPKPKAAPPRPKPRDNPLQKYLPWLFVILGVAAIGWMIATNKPEKPLTCRNRAGVSSLTAIGSCSEN